MTGFRPDVLKKFQPFATDVFIHSICRISFECLNIFPSLGVDDCSVFATLLEPFRHDRNGLSLLLRVSVVGFKKQRFLEAVQKNYGKAGVDSKEFFDHVQRTMSSTEDPGLRTVLRDTLATRDGDAAALSEIQPPLSKIEQTAKH